MARPIRRVTGPMRTGRPGGEYRILLSAAPDPAWRRKWFQILDVSAAARPLAILLAGGNSKSLTFTTTGDLRADVTLIDQLLEAVVP